MDLLQKVKILEEIIAVMPGNVYWINRDNVYQGCNNNMAAASGLKSREKIVSLRNKDLPWNADFPALAEDLDKVNSAVMEKGVIQIIEEPGTLKDGTEIIYLSHKVPLKEGNKVIGLVGISVDITERKNLEKKYKIAKEEAEASNFLMTEFIANMGHDFATPLSDVGATANLLLFFSKDYPDLKDYFETLVVRTEDCEKVRKRCINATSISNLEVKPEKFSISMELLKLEKDLRPLVGLKDIKFVILPISPRKDDIIITDLIKFQAILRALITNAINFTEKGQITLAAYRHKDEFKIEITDTGVGIPTDKFEYIFKQYTKLSASNRSVEFKGVGAGLYLARILAGILNAAISVKSKVGKGSTFTLTIPGCNEKRLK